MMRQQASARFFAVRLKSSFRIQLMKRQKLGFGLPGVILAAALLFMALPGPGAAAQEAPAEWVEDLNARTETTRTLEKGNERQVIVKDGNIHYWNGGQLELIDNAFIPAAAPFDYQMLKDGYFVRAVADFSAGQIMEYSVGADTIDFQPMPLKYANDLEQIQQIEIPQAVSAVVVNTPYLLGGANTTEGELIWFDAYGSGIDFTYKASPSRLNKLLTIGAFADLPAPEQFIIDGGNPVIALEFLFDPSGGLDIYHDGALWNKRDTIADAGIVEFRAGSETLFAFTAPRYWDSGHDDILATTTLEKRGNSLYASVRVPYSWLESAAYPVYIDPSVTVATASQWEDVHYRVTPSQWFGTTECRAGGDAGFPQIGCGMRFAGLSIPIGSTPTDASMLLHSDRNISGATTNTRFAGENVSNPAAFADDSAAFWTRYQNRVASEVDWDSLPGWSINVDYTSPNLTTIIADVLALATGTTTSIVIFWQDYDDRSGGGGGCANCVRVAESWDTESANAPELTITYTLPPMQPPPIFQLTDLGGITIAANWTAGTGANVTSYFIFVSREEYPDAATGYELAYSGNSSVLAANLTGYSANSSPYYMAIYSYGNSAFSENSTLASIGSGVNLTGLISDDDMEGLTEQATTANALFQELMLLIPLTIVFLAGVFSRYNFLTAGGGIGWMLYGFNYWTTDENLSILFVVIGMGMFGASFIKNKKAA